MSGSGASTSTSSSSQTKVNELNLQDTGGITVADNKGQTALTYVSQTTDANAVKAGTAVATSAVQAANDLGTSAISAGTTIANKGLDNAAAAYQSGLTFGTNALDVVQAIAQQFASQNEQLTGDALSGYQSIAQQNSASTSTQIQKVALYAIVALVVILVVPKVFK